MSDGRVYVSEARARLRPNCCSPRAPDELGRSEMRDGGAFGRLALLSLDERMPVELVAHGRADRSRAPAVDDAHLREACERRVVDERADRLPGFVRACPPDVELVRDVAPRAGEHLNRRIDGLLRLGVARVRAQARQRDAHALT